VIRLGWTLTHAGGWPRFALLASCTAVVTAPLLVVARLPEYPDERLFSLVAESGTRGGTAFGIALLTVPPLLLLYQAVRLGAVEVGVPALVGSAAGVLGYLTLRGLFGGQALDDPALAAGRPELKLVPTTVGPTWWMTLLVVVGVAGAGVVVGLRASQAVVSSPYAVRRRQTARPPRPWGLALLALAPVLLLISYNGASQILGSGAVGLALLGMWAWGLGWPTEPAGSPKPTPPPPLVSSRPADWSPTPARRAAPRRPWAASRWSREGREC